MNNKGQVTPSIMEFVAHREELIKFVRAGMLEQGVDKLEAAQAVACIDFWPSREVENLYKCIKSDLPEETIKAIVAHDYNGLRNNHEDCLPKSRQFEGRE